MKRYRICVDTNVWIDFIERKSDEAKKSRELLQSLTEVTASTHKIIIPEIIYLEIMFKLIEFRKEKYLITQGYSSSDLKGSGGKKLKFDTTLPKTEMKKIENILKDLETSAEIVSPPVDFSKVRSLLKQGFELLDSMIIVQANENVDYFVTKDATARRINNVKGEINWIKIEGISVKGMLKLLERQVSKKLT